VLERVLLPPQPPFHMSPLRLDVALAFLEILLALDCRGGGLAIHNGTHARHPSDRPHHTLDLQGPLSVLHVFGTLPIERQRPRRGPRRLPESYCFRRHRGCICKRGPRRLPESYCFRRRWGCICEHLQGGLQLLIAVQGYNVLPHLPKIVAEVGYLRLHGDTMAPLLMYILAVVQQSVVHLPQGRAQFANQRLHGDPKAPLLIAEPGD